MQSCASLARQGRPRSDGVSGQGCIGCAVLVEMRSFSVGAGSDGKVDVWIGHFLSRRAVADDEECRISIGEVEEVVTVAAYPSRLFARRMYCRPVALLVPCVIVAIASRTSSTVAMRRVTGRSAARNRRAVASKLRRLWTRAVLN
jgi:hypothetical protein